MPQHQQTIDNLGLSSVSPVSGRKFIKDNSFSLPATLLGGVQAYGPQTPATSQMDVQVISHPTTGRVALYKSVSNDLVSKIVSNKFVELASLLDPKEDITVFATKSQMTDEGFKPVWSPLHPKAKPLSVLHWEQAFTKYVSVYANHYPRNTQALFTYMFKVLDLASSKGDWAYLKCEFRKDKATSGYSFSAHIVDLYAKALMRGASNLSFRPQQSNSFYGTNQPGQQIPRGFCYGFHTRGSRCFNGSQCKFGHKCFLCKSQKPHPSYNCYQSGGGAGDSSQMYSAGKSFHEQSASQKSTPLSKGKKSNS